MGVPQRTQEKKKVLAFFWRRSCVGLRQIFCFSLLWRDESDWRRFCEVKTLSFFSPGIVSFIFSDSCVVEISKVITMIIIKKLRCESCNGRCRFNKCSFPDYILCFSQARLVIALWVNIHVPGSLSLTTKRFLWDSYPCHNFPAELYLVAVVVAVFFFFFHNERCFVVYFSFFSLTHPLLTISLELIYIYIYIYFQYIILIVSIKRLVSFTRHVKYITIKTPYG